VQASQAQQFTSSIALNPNAAVNWSISPSTGTIGNTGLYTAPASVGSQQTVTVTATSVADPTKSASATITLNPPVQNLSITPSSQNLFAAGTQQFTALSGGIATNNVTWTITPTLGTVNSSGLYTAPDVMQSQTVVTVKATSTIDGSKSATSPVTLGPLSMTISPSSASLNAGQTQQFSASITHNPNTAVTWTISPANSGSISSSGLYAAPAVVSSQQTVTATATSVADPTKSISSTITLMQSSTVQNISLTPSSQNLFAIETQQFTALSGGIATTAVTWTINPIGVGSVSSAGLYTAPSVIPSQTTVTVTATSTADPSKSGSAPVTLGPLSMNISPSSANLQSGQTQQFSAPVTHNPNTAVTWSINPSGVGSINSSGLYSAPATVSSSQTVIVKATSSADATKSVTANVQLQP
jgi:hypothetical protein